MTGSDRPAAESPAKGSRQAGPANAPQQLAAGASPLFREGSLFTSHLLVLEVTRLLGQLPKSEPSSPGSEESVFMLHWTGCVPDVDHT